MSRIVYIDYLRNFTNITRCLVHASVPYMVTIAPIWPVDENGQLVDFFYSTTSPMSSKIIKLL